MKIKVWQTELVFTKLGLEQTGQPGHRCVGLAAFGVDNHLTAVWRSQRQHIQDALAVHSDSVLDNPNICIKLRRYLYDLCGRPGMQAFLVGNNELLFQNAVPIPC